MVSAFELLRGPYPGYRRLYSLASIANLFATQSSIAIDDKDDTICSWEEMSEGTSAKSRMPRQIHEMHWQVQGSDILP